MEKKNNNNIMEHWPNSSSRLPHGGLTKKNPYSKKRQDGAVSQ